MFNYKILILESDKSVNLVIKDILDNSNFETFGAHDFKEAIEIMSQNWPELILLDFSFANGNGLEFINDVEEKFGQIPNFIVMTSTVDEKTASLVFKRGAIDYIVKNDVFFNDLNDIIVHAFKEIEIRNKLCDDYGKLNERENKYRLIFENSNVGIARIRYKDWFVLDCNNCFARQMGYSLRDNLINNILSNESFIQNATNSLCSWNGMENNEIRIDRSHDKSIYLLISAYAYWDEGYIDYMSVDITKQKEAEIEMEIAKIRAENADKEKSEFITRINHQIRTPLSTVIGFSELLSNKITDEKHRKYLDAISNSGKHLLSLINDMLDFSKLEAGIMSIVLEKIDIKQLIISIIRQLEKDLFDKEIEVVLEMEEDFPKFIYSDEARLKQVFCNIIGNSVKFTEKGKIQFGAYVIKEDKKNSSISLKFEIKDTGIGIPKEEIDLVFEPFVQKKGQDDLKYGGVGLGLSISKKIVELINGQIEVESEFSVGSTFRLTLFDLKFES